MIEKEVKEVVKKYFPKRITINNDISLKEITTMASIDMETKKGRLYVHTILKQLGYRSKPIEPTEHDIKIGKVYYSVSSKKVNDIAKKYSIFPIAYTKKGIEVFGVWLNFDQELKKKEKGV